MLYCSYNLTCGLASKAMAIQIKRVTPSFGPAIAKHTLPLQSSELSQMPSTSGTRLLAMM